MIYTINTDVVYVRGFSNGAIYNFNDNNLFSINNIACSIVEKYINNDIQSLNFAEQDYISLLKEKHLISLKHIPKEYHSTREDCNLEMVWLEITQQCNLKCLHCYQGDVHVPGQQLNFNDWCRIIDELKRLKVKRIIIIGGEPCCAPILLDILNYLKKYKDEIDITLFTNGTMLDEDLFSVIAKNNIRVKFSLYGHSADLHEHITQVKGSFKKMLTNIMRLKNEDISIGVAIIAMKENQDYLEEIKRFVKGLNLDYTEFDVIRCVYGGSQKEHYPTKLEIAKLGIRSKPYFIANKLEFDKNCFFNSCWAGKIAITDSGHILPCVFERKISYGNVKQATISEIINSETLKRYWQYNLSNVNICKDCEFRFACKDCRPVAMSNDGNLSSKTPNCMYNPYSGVWEESIQ